MISKEPTFEEIVTTVVNEFIPAAYAKGAILAAHNADIVAVLESLLPPVIAYKNDSERELITELVQPIQLLITKYKETQNG